MWEKDVVVAVAASEESRKRKRADSEDPAASAATEANRRAVVRAAGVPPKVPAKASSASTPSVRRKFKHPLDQFGEDEVALWLHDELQGSLSQMARIKLDLPRDSWARAAWRASIAMEHTVLAMPIKHRRRLYTLMRHITDPEAVPSLRIDDVSETDGPSAAETTSSFPARSFADVASATADHLVPELGMTLGHLSVFHILHARTQYVKRLDLEGHVDAAELTQPQAASHRIMIEPACD